MTQELDMIAAISNLKSIQLKATVVYERPKLLTIINCVGTRLSIDRFTTISQWKTIQPNFEPLVDKLTSTISQSKSSNIFVQRFSLWRNFHILLCIYLPNLFLFILN